MFAKLRFAFQAISEGFKEVFTLDFYRGSVIQEQPMEQQIVYSQFEEAINQWEARTGKKVERSFTEGKKSEENGKKVTEWSGDEWRNFAEFLGSREASAYRRQWKVDLTQVLREMAEGQPEMRIDGEEDFDEKLRHLRENGL